MDELLIEEKRYVSSKRAAQVTGYAKDYIGQLCREGRVPARLVGRNWYVLETAINDHRFGKQAFGSKEDTTASAAILSATWESPRYEPASVEVIPLVSRLREESVSITGDQNDKSEHFQDSWKEWFGQISNAELTTPVIANDKKEELPVPIEEIKSESIETPVSIHTVYEPPPETLLPNHHQEVRFSHEQEAEPQRKRKSGKRAAIRTMQAAGIVLAIVMTTLAVVGTGYFDDYMISNRQVSIFAGVIMYNR